MLAPFGCDEVRVMHGEEEDRSAGRLVVPKFPDGTRVEEQGPSSSGKNPKQDDEQGGSCRSEEPMQQEIDQAEKEDDKASTGGMSSLNFNFLCDFESGPDTLEGTTEPADEGTSMLEPPSDFIEMNRSLLESSSPSNSKNAEKELLMESPKRRRLEGTASVLFLETLPEAKWEVYHRDHESRLACSMDRVAFMEEVWSLVQSYGTQSRLKTGLNISLVREVLGKLDECEGRLSELLIESGTEESEANSPIKTTPQEGNDEVVYLSRTREGTMRSNVMIDKINDLKMKLVSKMTRRKAGKTKVDSEISVKADNSAKRKRVEEAMDMGQGDDQLPGTD